MVPVKATQQRSRSRRKRTRAIGALATEYDALARTGNAVHRPVRTTTRALDYVRAEAAGVRRELIVRERLMRVFLASLGDVAAAWGGGGRRGRLGAR